VGFAAVAGAGEGERDGEAARELARELARDPVRDGEREGEAAVRLLRLRFAFFAAGEDERLSDVSVRVARRLLPALRAGVGLGGADV